MMEKNETVNVEQNEREFMDEQYTEDEVTDTADAVVDVKVSGDGGETWDRRKIDLGGEIDESGLNAGEIFQVNGEKYRVVSTDFGLTIEPLNKPIEKKRSSRKR